MNTVETQDALRKLFSENLPPVDAETGRTALQARLNRSPAEAPTPLGRRNHGPAIAAGSLAAVALIGIISAATLGAFGGGEPHVAVEKTAGSLRPTGSAPSGNQTMTGFASTVLGLPLNDQKLAEIVVYGKVVKIDPGRWNSPDGKAWVPDDPSGATMPLIYRTYYVEPTEVLKGTPKWGTPVAFIIQGGFFENTTTGPIGPVSVGDTVLVLGGDWVARGVYGEAYWKERAYFSLEGDHSVFVLLDGILTRASHLSPDGRAWESLQADEGGTVELDKMRQAIAATKAGKSVQWYGDRPTTTTTTANPQ